MDSIKFGNFVAERRRELGLTQNQLAQRLSVTNKAVSRWETGSGFPDITLLEPLADALGVSVVELMHSKRLDLDSETEKAADKAVSDAIELAAMKNAQREFIVAVVLLSIVAAAVIALGFYFPSAPTVWTLPFVFCLTSGTGCLINALRKRSKGLPTALWFTVSGILLTIVVIQTTVLTWLAIFAAEGWLK